MPESHPHTDPSLLAGNLAVDVSENLHSAMAEVLPLLELDEAEGAQGFSAYVERRTRDLSVYESNKSIGNTHGGTRMFISPEALLYGADLFEKPYRLDDPSAYERVFPGLRAYHARARGDFPSEEQDRLYTNAAISAVNYSQASYFESYVGNILRREYVLGDFVDDTDTASVLSVADLKKVAVCQERAAVAHNTLMILGVTSELRAGYLSERKEDGTVEGQAHAFLVVSTAKGNKYIFDPTNPIVIRDESGNIAQTNPAIYKFDDKTTGSQAAQLKSYQVVDGEARPLEDRELTYSW